ncbi:NGFI-A-binding protein 1 isoform X2 [Lingula anatina]|uniref:NGFI-A-binding protein 1 isoform X2 n=1 Tax=Lingula anatina TaxID=7574 RepID=A0A1S3H8K7_LINAN|nr:NGFI-A-binding protein 1 isoform X2 [Lingula anatina]|eukprot:XP_013381464.1 NGFI-A-binding protein 1 isoform X2 [Lingula anatina]
MLAYTSGADSMLTYPERTSHSDTASLAQTAPHMPHTVHSLPAPPGLIHSSNPRSYPSLPPLPPPRTRDCRDLSVRASSLLNNRSDSNVPYRLRGTRSPPPRYNNRLEALYLLQKGQVCNQGRLMMTSTVPSSQSELQLYRVLQRANLLQYFDIFIAQGGDDVQQLCEAGEEEFLEIMALVGMASKPLHVRRLQKALQDWVANPALFQQPHTGSSPTSGGSAQPSPLTTSVRSGLSAIYPSSSGPNVVTAPTWNPQPARPTNSLSPSPSGGGAGLSPVLNLREDSNHQDDADLKRNSDSPIPTPVLVESQIAAIAEAAEKLVPTLPQFEPKPMNMRKQINKEIEEVINMDPSHPDRMDLVRKYAAIYGRFDSKRKNDKPMSLHEISVNEGAAQLCKLMPALLTRREDLFPLARQVVRDSGYQYSKGHSRYSKSGVMPGESPLKKPRIDGVLHRQHDLNSKSVKAELDQIKREERMTQINQELHEVAQQQEEVKTQIQLARDEENFPRIHELQTELENLTSKQLQLLTEQSEIIRRQRRSQIYNMTKKATNGNTSLEDDGTDSSNIPSGSTSPQHEGHEEDLDFSRHDFYRVPPKANPQKTRQFVQETLFDEGLRIAQQYGMAEFAEELIGMKEKTFDEENEDARSCNRDGVKEEPKDDLMGEQNGDFENSRCDSDICENGSTKNCLENEEQLKNELDGHEVSRDSIDSRNEQDGMNPQSAVEMNGCKQNGFGTISYDNSQAA